MTERPVQQQNGPGGEVTHSVGGANHWHFAFGVRVKWCEMVIKLVIEGEMRRDSMRRFRVDAMMWDKTRCIELC